MVDSNDIQTALRALGEFASSDIADAQVKLGITYGGYLDGLKGFSPDQSHEPDAKLFGPIMTVRMVEAADRVAPTPTKHFVDCVPSGYIVFISQPTIHPTACWGGLMSTRAQMQGAKGVVIDGNFRDILEHRALEFPVFARGVSPVGSASYTRSAEINVPLQSRSVGALMVRPDDYLLADIDGVVLIRPETAVECLRLVRERFDIDQKTLQAIKEGQEMGLTIKRLRK